MRKRFKISLIIIVILIILGSVTLISFKFRTNDNNVISKQIDKIDNYNYVLEERDSILMQNVFKDLKKTLENNEINYEDYAIYLSELFIIDLFTINNKINKYDVGGLEYVLDDIKDNYSLNVQDTIYKYIVDNSKRSEDEVYSVVTSITKESLENTKYTYKDLEYEAYKVTLNWEYEKDLGYHTKGEVILIKKDNKLYVVSYKGVE